MEENTYMDEKKGDYTWARKFITENELLLRDKLIRSFLLKKENCFLLNQSIRYSTPETNKVLDQAFQDHFSEVMLISQLSNELRRHAIRYDKRINAYRKKQVLMLDQPVDDETDRSTTLVNVIPDKQMLPTDEAIYTNYQQLEYIIENAKLYHAVQSLTPKQKQILNASYLLNMTDTEIAAKEGVSQQSISKTRKRALRNLKNQW